MCTLQSVALSYCLSQRPITSLIMTDGTGADREMCMDQIILGIAALIALAALIVIVPCLIVASDADDEMGCD